MSINCISAFTWFALSEYILAVSNMAFHFTITLDFPHEQLIVTKNFRTLKTDWSVLYIELKTYDTNILLPYTI